MQPESLSATRYVAGPKSDVESAVNHSARMVGHGKRVLEIGPATGMLTQVLAEEQGCHVTAIEIDPDAARLAAAYCERIHVSDLEQIDIAALLGGQRFDVITFGDVLEHLRSPLAALKKVQPYLADGGYIVVSVPNISHASVAYELAHGRFVYRATGLLDATHIRFFTKDSLLALLSEAGFGLLELSRFRLEPHNTEFATVPKTSGQRALLDYLLSSNSEARTYQFIVKTAPVLGVALSLPVLESESRAQEGLPVIESPPHAIAAMAWNEGLWARRLLRRVRVVLEDLGLVGRLL